MTSTRAPVVVVLAAATLAAAMLLLPATSDAARSRVIQADNVIGGYKVKKDGSLAGAIAVFGKPTSTKRRGSACNVRWKRLGIRSTFAEFGGGNPCAPADGRFTSATITGKGWRTASGLKIRNSWKRIPKLHPNARFNGATRPSGPWWLVARPDPFLEPAGALSPRLLAQVKQGRVVKFTVNFRAAGD